jgi:hypothetical protein
MRNTPLRRAKVGPLVFAVMALLAGLACSLTASQTEQAAPVPVVPIDPATPVPVEPTADPTVPPPPAPDIVYEGVSFNYNPAIASSIRPEVVPFEEIDVESPIGGSIPEHRRFNFDGYPLPGTFHEAYIVVYPVAEFQSVNNNAARVIPDHQSFMAARPTITDPANPDDYIPFLPVWPAAQVFRSLVQYLDFQNGTGVRFLTQFAQALVTVNNEELFYTYQGMTSDGAHYVAAVLPVSHPSLPSDGTQVPGGDFDAWANDYGNYLQTTLAELEAQPDSSFTPDLALLDAMIQSLLVQ